MQAFPQIFAGMFTNDASLLAFSAKALRIYCGALFMMGIQIACQMTFVSTGNAVCSIIVAIMRKFVLLIAHLHSATFSCRQDQGCLHCGTDR